MWVMAYRCALRSCQKRTMDLAERGWIEVKITGDGNAQVLYTCCSRLHAAEHFARALSELGN